ncbi:GNAT family N-acetyltransferase [Caldimonas sp. KR1-144]|uniref:GNAT family N-acetyltransferase n=1 Tax=Caldimonas sp. KR1-144 TaxID=3400911 RepID=UPI003BFD67B1
MSAQDQALAARLARLSPGWRSDLIFPAFDGVVAERGEALVVRTPSNPHYYWGNFMLYERAPRAGELAAWVAAFEHEVHGVQPSSRHIALGLDGVASFELPDEPAAQGFECHAATVLTMRREQLTPQPEAPRLDGARIGSLEPRGYAAAVELQCLCSEADGEGFEPALFRDFRERQMARYAAMNRAGRGDWFGVFAPGDRLLAECGLFTDATGRIGRFQHVDTHPDWRRRGLCRALMHAVARHGFERLGVDELVIVADPDDVAIGLYESLGFRRGATTWQLQRRAPVDMTSR